MYQEGYNVWKSIISVFHPVNPKSMDNQSYSIVCHISLKSYSILYYVKLKNDNANLIAKINKLNESIASLKIENDKFITKAKNLNICNDIVSNLRNEMSCYMLRLMN